MPTSILIAYATNTGSTKEVAETIGSALEEGRNTVEVARAPGGPAPGG